MQPVCSRAARNSWRRNGQSVPPSAFHSRGAMSSMLEWTWARTIPAACLALACPLERGDLQPLQVAVGVERRHAARTGGGDRLAIDMIGHIASGEDARHARRGGIPFGAATHLDVAVTHLELAGEDGGIRLVSDRDEGTRD